MADGIIRAEDETRTRDPDLGKVVLYQLSYFRMCLTGRKNKRIIEMEKKMFFEGR